MRKRIHRLLTSSGRGITYDRVNVSVILISLSPLFFRSTSGAFLHLDRVTGALFIVDYLLRWSTADFQRPDRGRMAFVYYPFGLFAVIDLVCILPSLGIARLSWNLLRLLRLVRALKALKLLRYSKSFQLLLSIVDQQRGPLLTVFAHSMGYTVVSALVMFNAEPQNYRTFFDAFYWAVITLTTVGYGDVHPTTTIGKVVTIVSSVVGIAVLALPTAIISGAYATALEEKKEAEEWGGPFQF